MSIEIVLLIVSLVLIAAAMFSFFGYIKISNAMFERLTGKVDETRNQESLKQSPYKIVRFYKEYNGRNVYLIYKSGSKATLQEFSSPKEAQTSMNELETLEGYKRTKVV